MGTRTYDPKKVTMTFGEVLITGYAEGTFIKASRNKARFNVKIGARGEGCRVKINDRSGRVEVTLQQDSPVNDHLSAIAASDEAANLGARPLGLVDMSGTTLVATDSAWIVKDPDDEFATDATNRVWVFEAVELIKFTGGSLET